MHLHYSLYNFSSLSKTTEWDLSGNDIKGERNNFPEIDSPNPLEFSTENKIGPPASFKYNGTSTLTIGYNKTPINVIFSMSFWVKAGELLSNATIFSTNTVGDVKIELTQIDKTLKINDTEITEISNSNFDFIVISAGNLYYEVWKNGIKVETVNEELKINGTIFTMLEGFAGRFADFRIHKWFLMDEEVDMLYRAIAGFDEDEAYLPYIYATHGRTRLSSSEKNNITKSKVFKMEGVYEYFPEEEGVLKEFNEPSSSFKLVNINTILDTSRKGRTPYPLNNTVSTLDSLCYFQAEIKPSSLIPNLTISAINVTGSSASTIQSRDYTSIPTSTFTKIFLVFRTLEKNVSKFEMSYTSRLDITIEVKNMKLVNLTHSGVEKYLYYKDIYPTYSSSSNLYSCGNEITNWCTSQFSNVSFINNNAEVIIPEMIFQKLGTEDGKSGLVKIGKIPGVISKNINEFLILKEKQPD
jgi:hypothetical protein